MSPRRISGSIFWGLIFVAFGSLILARNLGATFPLWNGVIRYWPAVLILWGLFKLVDYLRMDERDRSRPVFSAGDVAIVVVVILFGSLLTVAANMSPNLGKFFETGAFDLWDLTGNNFSFTEKHVMDASPDSKIEISNRYGDVEVLPSEGDRITVDVAKTIRASDRTEAERRSSGFEYSIVRDGSTYRIGANFSNRYKASLSVHVPRRAIVAVENRNGKVTIRGLTGDQQITNRFGDIEVHEIIGMVTIQNQNGDVHVDDVSGSVTIANSFASVNVANVRGDLKISGRNSSVDVEHIEKDLDVESAFQNIDIRDARGAVHVQNRNGEISIRLLQPPMQDVSVSSEFGNVKVEVPSGAAFRVDVHNEFGNIHSDFEGLSTTSNNASGTLTGQVGSGGPTIKISSRNGEIQIRKRG